jgi:hypothetical protein
MSFNLRRVVVFARGFVSAIWRFILLAFFQSNRTITAKVTTNTKKHRFYKGTNLLCSLTHLGQEAWRLP